jgi:hypothetical protein
VFDSPAPMVAPLRFAFRGTAPHALRYGQSLARRQKAWTGQVVGFDARRADPTTSTFDGGEAGPLAASFNATTVKE